MITAAFDGLPARERAEILRHIAHRLEAKKVGQRGAEYLRGWAEQLDPLIPHEPYGRDAVARDRHGRIWERARGEFGWRRVDYVPVLTWALLWENHGPLTVYEAKQ